MEQKSSLTCKENAMRLIIIGYGWRSLFYYRIAKAMSERFTLVSWVLRTEERAREVAELYQVETTTDIPSALSYDHDLVIVSVSAPNVEALLRTLFKKKETILCETSFTALPLETLNSLYLAYRNSESKLFIAEQYYRYPYYHSCYALTNLLGPLTGVRSASLHDHHGTSIIRHFLGEKGSNCSIQASCQTSWIIQTGKRDHIESKGERVQTKRTVATMVFEDGKTGYFDFADMQYHSCIRSSHFSLFGERGEIVDDTLHYLNEENEGISQRLERIEDGNRNNNPLSLRALTLGGNYIFRNPYWPLPFNDDEIAVALCMEEAGQGKGYSFAEALQDSYLAQGIKRSSLDNTLVQTQEQIWAPELKT
jgi:predicted dehydrogenase